MLKFTRNSQRSSSVDRIAERIAKPKELSTPVPRLNVARSRKQLSFDEETEAIRPPPRNAVPSPPPAVFRECKKRLQTNTSDNNRVTVVEQEMHRLDSASFISCNNTNTSLISKTTSTSTTTSIVPKSVLKQTPTYDFHQMVEKLVEKLDLELLDTSSESGYGSDNHDSLTSMRPNHLHQHHRRQHKRVHFDSYVMLLQGIQEGNLDQVSTNLTRVSPEAMATEEVQNGFLRNVLEDNEPVVAELLAHGVSPNIEDPSGLTPLHLAAARSSLRMLQLLLRYGAAIFARAHSSGKVPSDLCEPSNLPDTALSSSSMKCQAYLRCMEECLGVSNAGRVFAIRSYVTSRQDELCVRQLGAVVTVLRRGDYPGSDWWWCRDDETGDEGYVLKEHLAHNRPRQAAQRDM